MADSLGGGAGLVRWWLGELRALVPEFARGWLGMAHSGGWLVPRGQRLEVRAGPQAEAGRLGELAATAADSDPRALRSARAGAYLCLDKGSLLVREVSLPLAAADNLHQVLGYEMDRHTPFGADQVYYDCRLLAREHERGRLRAVLYVAPRERVQPWLDWLRALGVPLRGLVPRELAAGGDTRLNLLPAADRDRPSRWPAILNAALALLLLGLIGAALGLPLYAQSRVLAELEPELRSARAAAEETSQLRERLQQATEDARFLPSRHAERIDLLELLGELTRLLPDDTWLRHLELDGVAVSLFGESASAAALVPLLEASPMFANVRFRSPVTQDPRSGSERFQLALDLARGSEGR